MMSALIEKLLARASDVRTGECVADGITIRVREPSAAVEGRYASLWTIGKPNHAVAVLFEHCVIGDDGQPCLTAEQALILAQSGPDLSAPIIAEINRLSVPEKKADAPGADAVPDQPAAGAAAE